MYSDLNGSQANLMGIARKLDGKPNNSCTAYPVHNKKNVLTWVEYAFLG